MNVALRPAASPTANSFGHIADARAGECDRINTFLARGGSVLFRRDGWASWQSVVWAAPEGRLVRLRFEGGDERLVGTESNDSYALEWRAA